ncbi:MAG: hypothetical protein ABSC00_07140 [Acidimicrobiales bacterium]|jgi:ABC-type phosphate transport system auxiliary subunit
MSAEPWLKRVLRSFLKRLFQPILTRAYARIDLRIEALTRELNETVGELSALRRDIDRTVTTVLNALSNQNASARLQARALEMEHARLAEEISRQIELVRKEITLEAGYGPPVDAREDVETNVLDS